MESDSGDEPETRERSPERGRRKFLTPEQRRFLGTPRAAEPDSNRGDEQSPAEPTPKAEQAIEPPRRSAVNPAAADLKPADPSEERRKPRAGASTMSADKASRAIELRSAILVIGALLFIAMAFYAGKKFDYVRFLIASQKRAGDLDAIAQKFPNLSAEELVTTGLAARKRGDWNDAVERLLAAKRKNLALPGVLFLVGKGSFDRGDLDAADVAFANAIRFGENIAASNYHRGLIATRRHDTSSAVRYFEAAANAEPFVSDMYYFWAEALRLNNQPSEAIRRYQESEARSLSANDSTLCQFKIRLARIEAAQAAAIEQEIAAKRSAGSLSVDWLMTDAALRIHQGKPAEAAQLITEARAQGASGVFLTCAGDTVFRKAAETHAEVATVLRSVPAAN